MLLPNRAGAGGITDNATNEGQQKANLGDLRDFSAALLGTDSDDKAAALTALRALESTGLFNLSLVPSVAANALTMNVKTRAGAAPAAGDPVLVAHRNAVLGTGDFNLRKITAALLLTISSGSTVGHVNGVPGYLFWYLIEKDANTEKLAVCGTYQGQSGRYTTVAEGGGGAADAANVMYADEALADKPGRLIKISVDTQAAAGTWLNVPTEFRSAPFDVPIDGLEEDTAPSLASVAGDYAWVWDTSAAKYKRVLLSNIRPLPMDSVHGLTIANNAGDATNDIDIAVGARRDSTDADNMVLAGALTKQLDAAWAVGNNAGMRDTGAIANGTWHIFEIKRSDTGVVDILASLSRGAPTMPANYDRKRWIGAILRESAAIVPFVQIGNEFWRKAPVLDFTATNPTTGPVSRTLSVPVGVNVKAFMNVTTVAGAATNATYLSDLATTAADPSLSAAPLSQDVQDGNSTRSTPAQVWTNTSAQIRSEMLFSDANTILRVSTLGWLILRGQEL